MSDTFEFSGVPDCTIGIYPFEGGQFTLVGNPSQLGSNTTTSTGIIQSVTVNNTVRGAGGSFEIALGPGGPYGLNQPPYWINVITPMSLVVIGMRRAGQARIVMIGVVTQVSENETRTPMGVQRGLTIVGQDFARFFNTFNYYNLYTATGLGTAVLGAPAILGDLNAGRPFSSPAQLGQAFYTLAMAGDQGLLKQTQLPLPNGRRAFFPELMTTWFEEYPFAINIPAAATFIGSDGTWTEKFMTLMPFPYYEQFWVTVPTKYYPNATSAMTSVQLSGYPPSSPAFICRVNPQPYTPITASASGLPFGNSASGVAGSFDYDHTRWDALETYTLPTQPFSCSIGYSDAEVRNLYVQTSTFVATTFGNGNANIAPLAQDYGSWIDNESIHRYGFRPLNTEVIWYADPNGTYAQNVQPTYTDFNALLADCAMRVTSYFEPSALMARATISTLLHPEYLPGNKVLFAPYKDNVKWLFYIETVTHKYAFGQGAFTQMNLSRGLPQTVYADEDMMTAVLTGAAGWINGELKNDYVSNGGAISHVPNFFGVGGDSLAPFNLQTASVLAADNARIFNSPQSGYSASGRTS